MVCLYAFRGPRSFSSGMCASKAYKQNLVTAIIRIDVLGGVTHVQRCAGAHKKWKIVSRLLKVVETQFFFKMTAFVFYIEPYNNPKL